MNINEYFKPIITKKEETFDMIFTPLNYKHNEDVLYYWKGQLKYKLGINCEYQSNTEAIYLDPFHNPIGNALEAFFKSFTPNVVINLMMISKKI